jgi:hypothetical protein
MYVPFKREVVGKYEGGLSLIVVNRRERHSVLEEWR